ncbi:MAG: hypothetical protein H6853_07800 [Rhodospirillales bacterium]|nr:hypothetical protein [Alphaproteobacteria bacterium]USO03422.1 MAG: hypothetical protein H6853_07800 [Rhodospirillales bacterium]
MKNKDTGTDFLKAVRPELLPPSDAPTQAFLQDVKKIPGIVRLDRNGFSTGAPAAGLSSTPRL